MNIAETTVKCDEVLKKYPDANINYVLVGDDVMMCCRGSNSGYCSVLKKECPNGKPKRRRVKSLDGYTATVTPEEDAAAAVHNRRGIVNRLKELLD